MKKTIRYWPWTTAYVVLVLTTVLIIVVLQSVGVLQ